MNNSTGNTARPPERHTPIPTEAQRDGLACIRCHADFSAAPIPAVPAGLWNGCQMFRCRECPAASIDELIDDIAETAGRLFTQRFGEQTGPAAERLMRDTLRRIVSGAEVDLVLLREAFAALRRGDLATVDAAISLRTWRTQ
jgi:hypothetical protein